MQEYCFYHKRVNLFATHDSAVNQEHQYKRQSAYVELFPLRFAGESAHHRITPKGHQKGLEFATDPESRFLKFPGNELLLRVSPLCKV